MSEPQQDAPMSLRDRRYASSEARNAALRRLRQAHPEEYRAFYEEEARKRGIAPASEKRARRIARLRAELRKLEDEAIAERLGE